MQIKITAAENGSAKCTGTAYTGGQMNVGGFDLPIVVDLANMQIPEHIQLLANHDNRTESLIGSAVARVDNGELLIDGILTGANRQSREIIDQAKAGALFQLSIGAKCLKLAEIEDGKTIAANGKEQTGPFYLIEQSFLDEVSVVPLGADNKTDFQLSASAKLTNLIKGEANTMLTPELKKFIVEKYELDPAITDEALIKWLADNGKTLEDEEKALKTPPAPPAEGSEEDGEEEDGAIDAAVSRALKRIEARLAVANAIIDRNATLLGDKAADLKVRAAAEHWNAEKAASACLDSIRSARPSGGFGIKVAGDEIKTGTVVEAAAVLAGGLSADKAEKIYTAPVVDAALAELRKGFGLQQIILQAARANGFSDTSIGTGNLRDALQYANIRAAFSNVSLGGILSNVANKYLLDGYEGVDQTWKEITDIVNVKDFKTVSRYRLGADMQFKKVAKGGEIKSGSLSEKEMTISADTYGVAITITRQDIINDDLGAITKVPQLIGMTAGESFNLVFWTEFLNNSSFFSSSNSNLVTGADYVLSTKGLDAGIKAFRALKNEAGVRTNRTPKILLVPAGLESTANGLYTSQNLIADGVTSSKSVTTAINTHVGKYKPVVASYLDDSAISGYSNTAYYLLDDPAFRATIAAAFLNGVTKPTIETSEIEFEKLGIGMRAYLDFGVSLQDPCGGVKIKGAN